MLDPDRDRMRVLSTRLLDLHGVLLDRERRAYEEEHGLVASRELLHLLLHDQRFAWLRSLSSMIANIDAVERVMKGPHRAAMALVRPPGHHAERDRAMGFCLYNNVAVAAAHARTKGIARIAIVDYDVHHGNGTQHIFESDPNVLYVSTHQYPYYPGTGAAEETGTGRGLGFTLNVPVRFGTARRDYLAQFRSAIEKAAQTIRPELIFLSAGFDAHRRDPIGSLGLETEDFTKMTQAVLDVAKVHAQGRLVSCLEGGYKLEALAESVQTHAQHFRIASDPAGNFGRRVSFQTKFDQLPIGIVHFREQHLRLILQSNHFGRIGRGKRHDQIGQIG